jgi:hypothetical protein
MARINPISQNEIPDVTREAFEKHVRDYAGSRITNMKATLGHSLVAFEVYMQWYPLYDEVKKVVGNRLAYLYAYSISMASDCPLCSTFFRKIIIEAGESPENFEVDSEEQKLLSFGSDIARNKGYVTDAEFRTASGLYTTQQLVVLIAFAGQMIATNIFNNVIETEIDEYLNPYLPKTNTNESRPEK